MTAARREGPPARVDMYSIELAEGGPSFGAYRVDGGGVVVHVMPFYELPRERNARTAELQRLIDLAEDLILGGDRVHLRVHGHGLLWAPWEEHAVCLQESDEVAIVGASFRRDLHLRRAEDAAMQTLVVHVCGARATRQARLVSRAPGEA